MRALEIVGQRSEAVEASSRRLLRGLEFSPEEVRALSSLTLDRLSALRTGSLKTYRLALERQGQTLARRGIAEESARLVRFAQLEAAIPYLLREGDAAEELIVAMLRYAFTGSVSISAGYDHARTDSWRAFGERERQRLSRDLHDEIGHDLVVLKLYLEMIARDIKSGETTALQAKLEEALALIAQSLQSVRRLILDLGPAVLDEVGFLAAVRLYARQFSTHTGVKVEVSDRGVPDVLPASHETALYRVLQGALSNVVKHAQAKTVHVHVAMRGSVLVMTVEDDGVGFDPSALRQAFGLQAMRVRVESLGGRLKVRSRLTRAKRGRGTRIEIELPIGGVQTDEREDQRPRL